ncbi:hypothetical protein FT663_00209 [Candidozyma haemuli var. vulneris]|uniref:Phosphoribomutase n=1 Tax=Candidozyma haemuli TaxID=45357 RepID=A0A2V1AS35_9ASCO|nr:hypothetical protein CXQ85_003609 [[Candida] haemuloni]KAF3993539.1 hypothetical protein FT662_00459 [[Candida] haemuloni var. vulneris]KAF3995613.1 hypothetical protein FT663_00209 [[Candida] haemuloni var. vulneris]PVH19751.1 hypothetical protein CXQ85_003609 [[Candida] haemuloni]
MYNDEQKHQIDQLVSQWLQVDPNEVSRQEIQTLQAQNDYSTLDSKLSKRIAFGTAGLRSSMESGFAHMNDVTILQASQGLVAYLVSTLEGAPGSIVIGYDHRFHSQRYAEITASVALARGFTVYYLGTANSLSDESDPDSNPKDDKSYVHTPMVPFGIDYYQASAGVMVTASHNPAKDNGYKVYYGNGCQIIPPHDAGIAKSIDENLDPWLDRGVWNVKGNFAKGLEEKNLVLIKDELTQKYVSAVRDQLIQNKSISYDFVYTPMHGVGLEILSKIFQQFEAKQSAVDVVPEQAVPDAKFPSVPFPNPEEKGALDLAIARAEAQGFSLVVASDPDADRFSVAIRRRESGDWQQLTGNEIGILFAAFVVEELTSADDLHKTWLLNSTVSSQLLRSLAEKAGCHFQDTLTGFKWIGNKAIDLKKEGNLVPFGYEEAIGYMFGVVNDKDGISAAVMWLQLYEAWFSNGKQDPIDKLEKIYQKYGWFKECNGYYKLDDVSKTPRIFNETIRKSYPSNEHYPQTLGKFKVVEWRDLTIGYESVTANNVPILPSDPSSQMITAILQPQDATNNAEQVRFTCRGSGTEPKLKVYIEGRSNQSEESAIKLARACWDTLRDEWFKPKENGIQEVV